LGGGADAAVGGRDDRRGLDQLLAESRSGRHGGPLPWALLVAGSAASLAANVAVAEPTATGRVIAAWPSFALIASYELLMSQVRRAADASALWQPAGPSKWRDKAAADGAARRNPGQSSVPVGRYRREAQVLAWQWALANRTGNGSLPSGKDIGREHGRHERWGRLVKRAGMAGELDTHT
jgi:hypothetical protein